MIKKSLLVLLILSLAYFTGLAHRNEVKIAPRVDSVLQFQSIITAMYEDTKGNLWVGSHCDGVCRFDGRQYTYFTVDQGLPGDRVLEFAPGIDWSKTRKVQMGNSIRSIQEDKDGNMWFSTGDGVSKFDGHSFTTIYPENKSVLITESFTFNGKQADENWKSEFNHLWFGAMETNGVYRYDGQELTHLTFPISAASSNGSISQYATYSLYKDNEHNIWFGTEGGGIMKYREGEFYCINEKEEKGIVRSFFQDKSGRVWISNVTVGICYYENDELVNFTDEIGMLSLNYTRSHPDADKAMILDAVQCIGQDSSGDLWFGTFTDGLWRYDGNKFTHYTEENILPFNTVKSIFKDKSGNLWFGIGEGTVYGFNGTSFERFDGKL